MTQEELLAQDQLRPSEMKRLGKRVTYFNGSSTGENQDAATRELSARGGTVYTGLHSSCDWSRVYWWSKGWHLVNRTGDYAVVR